MVTVLTESRKRVTVKPFINTRNKPTVLDGVERFRLYLQITYDRKTTQVPFSLYHQLLPKSDSYFTEKEFHKMFISRNADPKHVGRFFSDMESGIRYELKEKGEANFSIKGLGDRLNTYRQLLLPEFSAYVQGMVESYLFQQIDKSTVSKLTTKYKYANSLDIIENLLEHERFKSRLSEFPDFLKTLLVCEYLLFINEEYEREEYSFLSWLNDSWLVVGSFDSSTRHLHREDGELLSRFYSFKDYKHFKIEKRSLTYIKLIDDFVKTQLGLF